MKITDMCVEARLKVVRQHQSRRKFDGTRVVLQAWEHPVAKSQGTLYHVISYNPDIEMITDNLQDAMREYTTRGGRL